jgi:hypothetical protein
MTGVIDLLMQRAQRSYCIINRTTYYYWYTFTN